MFSLWIFLTSECDGYVTLVNFSPSLYAMYYCTKTGCENQSQNQKSHLISATENLSYEHLCEFIKDFKNGSLLNKYIIIEFLMRLILKHVFNTFTI